MKVVLFLLDSVRADSVGYAGGALRTPQLDVLARAGTTYSHAMASAAWTVPSLTSIATGTLPHRVGVSRWRHPFPRHRPTLFTCFAAAGFEVRTLVHNPRWAYANFGFRGEVGDVEDADALVEALRAPRGVDRFVLVHYWWTHLPYRNERLGRRAWKGACDRALAELGEDPRNAGPRQRELYHRSIEYFDREVLPRCLDAAAESGDDVLLAVTADHGETWGASLPPDRRVSHMYDLHGRWLTEETTRVPLLLHGRGAAGPVPAATRLGGFVRGVDLAPTLAGLAGVPWPGGLPGGDGPTLVDQGIRPDGQGLVLDGVDLSESLLASRPSPLREALTLTSHNAVHPRRYPRSGAKAWPRWSLRTPRARYTWDGGEGLAEVTPIGQGGPTSWKRRLMERPSLVWRRLQAERRRAVPRGDNLDKELFPGLGDEDSLDADAEGVGSESELEAGLRMLGYTED